MATKNRKAQLEIEAKNNTKEPLNQVKRDLEGVGKAGQEAGRQATEGLKQVEQNAERATKALERQERSLVQSIQRRRALMEAEGRGQAAYQESIAKIRGLDRSPAVQAELTALRQLEQQIEQQKRAQLQAAEAAKAEAQAQREAAAARQRAQQQQRSFIESLKEQALYAGKSREEILELKAAQLGVGDEARQYIDSIRQSNAALQAGGKQLNEYGMTAKQTANAMRLIPMQMTDIVTQLMGGQSPLLVLTQQGGQLKDVFGGIQPALRGVGQYIMGLVNPVTVAAAGIAGLVLAFRTGAAESERFNKAIIETGGGAGVTTAELQAMAARLDGIVGTQRKASAALTEFARSTQVGRANIEEFTAAALRWEDATGTAVSDTVEKFEELGKAPLEASLKLNESMNYLTATLYEQIAALVDAGRETDAAALAQQAFADAINDRAPKIVENIGLIERAWRGVKGAVSEAIDAMAGIGREKSTLDLLTEAEERLRALETISNINFGFDPTGQVEKQREVVRALEAQLALESSIATIQRQADEERRKATEDAQFRREYRDDRLSHDEQRIKAINEEVQQFERATARLDKTSQEYQDLWRRHQAELKKIDEQYADKGTGGRSGASAQNEIARLRALIEVEQQREAALHSASAAQANLNEGEKLAIQYAERIKLATDGKTKSQLEANKALAEQYGALKRANDEYEDYIKQTESAIASVRKQADSLEEQIALHGMSRAAIEELTLARLQHTLAVAEENPVNERNLELLREQVQEQQRLVNAMYVKDALDMQVREWEQWEREVEQIFNRVGQSLTDAIFEGGKSGRELLKDIFKSITFNVLINPVMNQMQGWVTQNLGGMFGYQTPQQPRMQFGVPTFNTGSGGFSDMIYRAGEKMGSYAVQNFAAGMAGYMPNSVASGVLGGQLGGQFANTTFSASLSGSGASGAMANAGAMFGKALPYAGALFAASQGQYATGAGMAIGTAILPGVGTVAGGLIGGVVDSIFGGREPTTRRMQRNTAELIDGAWDITSRDGRQGDAAADAAQEIAKNAVNAANDLFEQIGVNAAIESFYAITESSYKRDRDGVASGGRVRIGDQVIDIGIPHASDMTLAGFGGWSDADMLPRLATDVQLTVLEAFQKVGDELPTVLSEMLDGIYIRDLGEAEAAELAQRFSAIVQEVSLFQDAVEQLPFAQLRDLSFDASANLLSFAGGLENLTANLGTYFSEFYSQEEQLQFATEQLGKAFGELGLELPDVSQGAQAAKAAYRDIVESLDLNTESGQRAYATLINLAGGFAEVVTGMDELNNAVVGTARTAQEIARERYGLETQLLQLQGNTVELRRRELEALDESNRGLQEHIWALQDQAEAAANRQAFADTMMGLVDTALAAVQQRGQERIAELSKTFGRTDSILNAYRTQVRQLESALGSVLNTIASGVADLRGEVDATARMQYEQARAVISTTLVTGRLPQTADLSEALQIARAGVTEQVYASREDQERAYLQLASEMEALKSIAEPELDAAKATLEQLERQYNRLRGIEDFSGRSLDELRKQFGVALSTEAAARTQIAQIERQLEIAQMQYQQLVGINKELSTLPGALNALAKAIDGATKAREAAGVSGVSREARYFANNPDVLSFYLSIAGSTTETAEEFARRHYEEYGRHEGRSFAVGTSFVPHDMTANIHKGEIIIDPRSSDILRRYGIEVQGGNDNREVVAEIRQLRAELKASQVAIAKNTMKTAKRLDEFGDIGMPVREEITA